MTTSPACTGIVVARYDDELWPVLTDARTRALTGGDGTVLLLLADVAAGRRPGGSSATSALEAQTATTCLDSPTNECLRDAVGAYLVGGTSRPRGRRAGPRPDGRRRPAAVSWALRSGTGGAGGRAPQRQ